MPTVDAERVANYHKANAELSRDMVLRRLDFQHSLAVGALKSTILVNGAAVISVMTFIGNSAQVVDRGKIILALSIFLAGITASLLAAACGFLSQASLMSGDTMDHYKGRLKEGGLQGEIPKNNYNLRGQALIHVGLLFIGLSISAFGCGAWFALQGLLPPG